MLGMTNLSKIYERNVYSLLDMLGNVGGLAECFHIISTLILILINTNLTESKLIKIFARNIVRINIYEHGSNKAQWLLIQDLKFRT